MLTVHSLGQAVCHGRGTSSRFLWARRDKHNRKGERIFLRWCKQVSASRELPWKPGVPLDKEKLPLCHFPCAMRMNKTQLPTTQTLGIETNLLFFPHVYTVVFWQILTCLSSNTVPSVQIYLQCQPANDPRTKEERGFRSTPVAYVMNPASKQQKPHTQQGMLPARDMELGNKEKRHWDSSPSTHPLVLEYNEWVAFRCGQAMLRPWICSLW